MEEGDVKICKSRTKATPKQKQKGEEETKWKYKINGISSSSFFSSSPFHFSFLFSCLLSRTGPAPDGNQLIASTNETERNRAMVWVRVRWKLATHNNVFMKTLIMALNSLPCFRSRLFFPHYSFISLTDMLFTNVCCSGCWADFFLHVSVSRFVSMCSEYILLFTKQKRRWKRRSLSRLLVFAVHIRPTYLVCDEINILKRVLRRIDCRTILKKDIWVKFHYILIFYYFVLKFANISWNIIFFLLALCI